MKSLSVRITYLLILYSPIPSEYTSLLSFAPSRWYPALLFPGYMAKDGILYYTVQNKWDSEKDILSMTQEEQKSHLPLSFSQTHSLPAQKRPVLPAVPDVQIPLVQIHPDYKLQIICRSSKASMKNLLQGVS